MAVLGNACGQWRVGESDIVAHRELWRGHCDVCFLEAAANISMTETKRKDAIRKSLVRLNV